MATYKTIKYIVPVEVVEHTDSINALADVDTSTAAPTEGQTIKWNGTNWVPGDIEESSSNATQKGIIAFGEDNNSLLSTSHLISSTGIIASAANGVGTARTELTATGYGGDKGIFFGGYTYDGGISTVGKSNLVSNTGVVATDVSNSSISARLGTYGVPIGYDGKAVFIFGKDTTSQTEPNYGKNIVSNTGVIGSDESAASGQTSRYNGASSSYGGDKGVIMGGQNFNGSVTSGVSNLISNTGVIASDVSYVSEEAHPDHFTWGTDPIDTANCNAAGTTYGSDGKAMFFGGGGDDWNSYFEYSFLSSIHLVSNVGVVASNTTQTTDQGSSAMLSGCSYGGDKGIFAHGKYREALEPFADDYLSKQNLVSNTGVISNQSTCAGARMNGDACGYSSTA